MFPSEELDAPTGGAIPALEDSSADENAGETGDPMLDNPFAIGVKEERRRQRIAYEMQLNKLERTVSPSQNYCLTKILRSRRKSTCWRLLAPPKHKRP